MKKVLLLGGTGLVGRAMAQALQDAYQVVLTSGHLESADVRRLTVEEPERLRVILDQEDPDVVISSVRGDFQAQLRFHQALADWLAGKDKRLLFVSTANVFDGDLSRPWTEADPPVPGSDYGIFKRDCESLLQAKLPGQLVIFRLSAVWAAECPRLRNLEEASRSGKPVQTVQGDRVNLSYTRQIGAYTRYVLDHDCTGVFHVGTTDTVDYAGFEGMVCRALGIRPPDFAVQTLEGGAFQAVIPTRAEIPEALQMTVDQVLEALKADREAQTAAGALG